MWLMHCRIRTRRFWQATKIRLHPLPPSSIVWPTTKKSNELSLVAVNAAGDGPKTQIPHRRPSKHYCGFFEKLSQLCLKRDVQSSHRLQPRSGGRVQPTAQAVGKQRE